MNIQIDTDIRLRAEQVLQALLDGLYEREEAMRLALLSTIAGESIFLLGPPGVGKSLIARRLKHAFRDGRSFEYLMSKFSTPDEIFGPVSIKKLKEEDRYERRTERYLPGANIVFLDEIWKAGPAIQNALLTILNEKIYRNGDQELAVNIRGIITASNELPPRNQSLDPIWDRFLLRLELGNIRQYRNFLQMITDTSDVYEDPVPEAVKIREEELEDWSRRIDEVTVPAEVLNTIQLVKLRIDEFNARAGAGEEIPIYDRRWKKIIRLLRSSAFLNGRSVVDLMDCFLLLHCLWSRPEHRERIEEIVTEAVRRHGYTLAVNLQMIRREVEDFEEEVEGEIRVKYTITEEHPLPVREQYYELNKDEAQFEGLLIPMAQYQKLQLDEQQVVNFFDEQGNLVNRLKALRGGKENTIDVFHNGIRYTYPLRVRQVERSEFIFKKPHPLVEKHWEERFQRLSEYIRQQDLQLRQHLPDAVNHLDENLFVPVRYSEVVKSNLREVGEALQSLALRLEKVRFSYQHFS